MTGPVHAQGRGGSPNNNHLIFKMEKLNIKGDRKGSTRNVQYIHNTPVHPFFRRTLQAGFAMVKNTSVVSNYFFLQNELNLLGSEYKFY